MNDSLFYGNFWTIIQQVDNIPQTYNNFITSLQKFDPSLLLY